MDFSSILTTISTLVQTKQAIFYGLIISLGFIIVDTLMGYLVAYKEGTFDWSKAPQTVAKNIFPFIGGLIVLAVFAVSISQLEAVFWLATGCVSVKFGKEIIIEKVKKLFNIGDSTSYETQISELKATIAELQAGGQKAETTNPTAEASSN